MKRTNNPVHFYHLWRGGNWRAIADEHYAALSAAGFNGEVHVNTIETGFEDVTLRLLRQACEKLPGDTPVLYAHNKGALHSGPKADQWRRDMTKHLVTDWVERVTELDAHDVAAWTWIDTGIYVDATGGKNLSPWPHATGNFWWARADYLRGLPHLPMLTYETRLEAEAWVGQDSPCVAAANHPPVL